MTERTAIRRILLAPGTAEDVAASIDRLWRRLLDPEPRPDDWLIRPHPKGAVVLSRHDDYTFDLSVASNVSEPRAQSWLIGLSPRLQIASWRAGKWVESNLAKVLAELARRGLDDLADVLRFGLVHAAVRVDQLSASARSALAKQLESRTGWEVKPIDGALVARGPTGDETQAWAGDVVRSHAGAQVVVFWRPWLGKPSVLDVSKPLNRAWYSPDMAAETPVGVERVEEMFGARDWEAIRAAAQLPPEWFPQVLGVE